MSGERVTQSDENENNKAVLHSQYNSVDELTSSWIFLLDQNMRVLLKYEKLFYLN